MSAGWEHACGIRQDQTVDCWGDNKHGRLDAPDGQFRSVSAGFWFSCGIKDDRTATCWGNNLRRGYNAPQGQFQAVSAGQGLACGLRPDDTAVCWGPPGAGTFGELDTPPGRFASVSAGTGQACGLRPDNTRECWGAVLETKWPAPCALSESLAALCWDSAATPWTQPSKYDVYVFICAAQGKYTQADLQFETDRMNDIVTAFYTRESSGIADVRFLPAAVSSPDIDWDTATINSLFAELTSPGKSPPCAQSAEHGYPGARFQHKLVLADISPRDHNGDCPSACAGHVVLIPTVEALYASRRICSKDVSPWLVRDLPSPSNASSGKDTESGNIRAGHNTSCRDLAYWVYDYVVAHEIGHALFGFGHPPDCSIMSGNPWACPAVRAQNMDDTLRSPNMLQTAYVGCADRRRAGWPQDPNRCPQDP